MQGTDGQILFGETLNCSCADLWRRAVLHRLVLERCYGPCQLCGTDGDDECCKIMLCIAAFFAVTSCSDDVILFASFFGLCVLPFSLLKILQLLCIE